MGARHRGCPVNRVIAAIEWSGSRGLIERTIAHLELVGLSLLIALVIAIPLGIVVGHTRRGGAVATMLVTAGRAVPTYAVIALLFPLAIIWGIGLGFWPSVVALVLLSIPPLYTNTYTGIRGVDAQLVEAARGVGMDGRQVLWGVEVPVALPLILAGVRTAVVQVMATATLAAIFGYQSLGSYLTEGLSQRDDAKLLTGTIAVGVLWLVAEVLLGLLQRWLTPWARADSSRAARRRSRAEGLAGPPATPGPTTAAAGAQPLPMSEVSP
jgi:osmoprotectant transport system permease protein